MYDPQLALERATAALAERDAALAAATKAATDAQKQVWGDQFSIRRMRLSIDVIEVAGGSSHPRAGSCTGGI